MQTTTSFWSVITLSHLLSPNGNLIAGDEPTIKPGAGRGSARFIHRSSRKVCSADFACCAIREVRLWYRVEGREGA